MRLGHKIKRRLQFWDCPGRLSAVWHSTAGYPRKSIHSLFCFVTLVLVSAPKVMRLLSFPFPS